MQKRPGCMVGHGALTRCRHSSLRSNTAAVLALISSALSKNGFDKIRQIMEGDEVLKDNQGNAPLFGKDLYYISLLGKPSEKDPWMLQFGGHHLALELLSMKFPAAGNLREGLGEIQIEFGASLPRGGANRTLVFENHHQDRIAAYLVNCLVPRDRNIGIVAQRRNPQQSFYQLDYTQIGGGVAALSF